MKKFLVLALGAASAAAAAQTPATRLMPDGSHDLYAGLGVQSAPRYEGSGERRERALPVLQFQWSNGAFIAASSAGIDLSQRPGLEYGPLLNVQGPRTGSGSGLAAGTVDNSKPVAPPHRDSGSFNRLDGMDRIGTRVELGAFLNAYLNEQLRLTNTLLYGAGNARDGLRWNIDLQRSIALAAHHSIAFGGGMTVVNSAYNRAYFGVSPEEAARSGNRAYRATGGIKDVHAGVRWNWALSPSLLLTSAGQLARLGGSAADSALVERATSLTVSSALAYRF